MHHFPPKGETVVDAVYMHTHQSQDVALPMQTPYKPFTWCGNWHVTQECGLQEASTSGLNYYGPSCCVLLCRTCPAIVSTVLHSGCCSTKRGIDEPS